MSDESRSVFTRRAVGWIVAASVASFLLAFVLAAYGDDIARPKTAGANAFSYSALGHRALVEFLERSGVPVSVGRDPTAAGCGPTVPLVVAEPPLAAASPTVALRRTAEKARAPFVLVLPKWHGVPLRLRPEWLGRVTPVAVGQVEMTVNPLLRELGSSEVSVRRLDGAQRLSCEDAAGAAYELELDSPQFVKTGDELEAVVRCDGRTLIARTRDDAGTDADAGTELNAGTDLKSVPVFLVADPDLLNNHGLSRGDNARLTRALFVEFLDAAAVVLDETAHGFARRASLVRELLRFPLVLSVLHGLLVVGLFVWAGAGRLGKPHPVPSRIADGKQALIDNAASLLSLGGHSALSLERYFGQTLKAVGAHFFLPADLPRERLLDRLQRISSDRGSKIDLAQLAERVDRIQSRGRSADRSVRLALKLHAWRKEMIDADRGDS